MDSATVTVGRGSTDLLKRIATAAVGIPAFVWLATWAPQWAFDLLVVAGAAVAAWELARMFQHAGLSISMPVSVPATAAVTASFAAPIPAAGPGVPALILTVAVAAALSAPVWLSARPAAEPVALAVLSVVYIGWFLGHVILLHRSADGHHLVLFLVGVTWIGESAAYLVGSLLGRHKLAPAISPNKTVEGALAQVIASMLAALLLGAWLLEDWKLIHLLVVSGLLGGIGQIGDLAESVLKRSVGVKDTGGLIPGHGGVLDRVDGLLFNAPALYYYVALGGGGA